MGAGTGGVAGDTVGLYEAIHRRRDVRAQFTGEPIPPEVLERMLSAAHAAPSVGLTQPWDFVLVSDPGLRKAFYAHVQEERQTFADTLTGTEAERFAGIKIDGVLEATLSVVVTYDPDRGSPAVLGRHAIADAGLYSTCLAIENLWLASTAEGMGMGWVSFYRERFVRQLLGIPETIRPVAWLCLGPGLPSRGGARPRAVRVARAHPAAQRPALRPMEQHHTRGGAMTTDQPEPTTPSPPKKAAPRKAAPRKAAPTRAATRTAAPRTAAPRRAAAGRPAAAPAAGRAGQAGPRGPFTLAIDIGGTGLKASVLDAAGAMAADPVRTATRYPMPPTGRGGMVPALTQLVAGLPAFDRVSAGFPGMVRGGRVLSAAHFVTVDGPGTAIDPKLVAAWANFDMAAALAKAIGKPTKVANDADVQGLAVVEGKGLELVVTLGTGFGTALFLDGRLLPHLEIAHQPFRKGQTYNEQVGERTRKRISQRKWNARVHKALRNLDGLFFFDHLYLGGGNASRVRRDDLGPLLERTTVVSNTAGILGGIKLWEERHLGV